MATIDELVVQIAADTAGLRAELKSGQDALVSTLAKMEKSTESFGKEGTKNLGVFEQAVATMAGVVGGQAVIAAFNQLKDAASFLFQTFIVDGVHAAIETQTALNNLSNALARNGNLLPGVAHSWEEFAQGIQETTVFSDDAALASASLLENLTKLDSAGLMRATNAAADLAAVLGIDLESAATMVGKAMNGNTQTLQRYGIEIEKSANSSKQAEMVLKTLGDRFGGAAKAQVATFSGSLTVLQNAFSDLTKVFGKGFIENKAVIEVLNALTNIVGDLTGDFEENSQAIREWIAGAMVKIIDVTGFVIGMFQELAKIVQFVSRTFEIAGTGLVGFFKAVSEIGSPSKAMAELGKSFENIKEIMARPIDGTKFLGDLSDKLAEIKGAADRGFEATVNGAKAVVEPVNHAKAAVKALTDEQQRALDLAVEFATKQAESADTVAERSAMELESLQAMYANKLLTDSEYFANRRKLTEESLAAEAAMVELARSNGKLTDEQYEAAKFANAQKGFQSRQKLLEDENKKKKEAADKQIQDLQSTFSTIASLASSHNKGLAAIGKAAAIADATMNTFKAANIALASAPPPFNFGLAAAVTAAGIANVAKIVGTPLATGIDSVPGIGARDQFPAVLAPGERVVPRETNKDLMNFLRNQQSGGGQNVNVSISVSDVFATDPREIGMRIIDMINEAGQANGVRILGATPA
jgi:hypothetical protein